MITDGFIISDKVTRFPRDLTTDTGRYAIPRRHRDGTLRRNCLHGRYFMIISSGVWPVPPRTALRILTVFEWPRTSLHDPFRRPARSTFFLRPVLSGRDNPRSYIKITYRRVRREGILLKNLNGIPFPITLSADRVPGRNTVIRVDE